MNPLASRPTVTLPHWSPVAWLAGTAMGTYLLVVTGAVAALTPAANACGTWPTCGGRWIVPFTDLARTVAWSHRLATVVVGLALCWTALRVHRTGRGRVRAATLFALVLFPAQVALGAVTAVDETTAALAAAHLLLAMALFAALVVALAWRLEATTPDGPVPTPDADGDDPAVVDDRGDAVASSPGPLAVARAYLELTKPKLTWLLCLVALAGMSLVGGPSLAAGTVVPTLAGGVLAVGASGTFNNVLERDADSRMERTADRPLPTDRIPPRNATAFGALLTFASLATFLAFVNALAAALGLLAILFYGVGYTLVLKPNTTQNVVVGGAVGAFPALIGWAAVTGRVGVPALLLGGVVFLWTPAHFYNLAIAYADDYANAEFPMMPVVRGRSTTRKHVLLYLGATLLGSAALGAMTDLGWLYAATTVLVGGAFLWAVVRLHRERTDRAALRAFHASNAYLGSLLLAIVVDTSLL